MKNVLKGIWGWLDGKKRILGTLLLLSPLSAQPMLLAAVQAWLLEPRSPEAIVTLLGQLGITGGAAHAIIKLVTRK